MTWLPGRGEVVAWCGVLVIASTWAAGPIGRAGPAANTIVEPAGPGGARAERAVPLELAAFDAPLWTVPAAPPAQPPPAPPPPALNLQLLAITGDGAQYRALAYDPAGDRVLTLCAGTSVGVRTVEAVTSSTVKFRLGDAVQTLALERSGRAPIPGGARP